MTSVEGLLGGLRVVDPELVVEHLPGPATLATGPRRSLVAVARGTVRIRGDELGPGDALLLHDAGSVPARPLGPDGPATVVVARFALQGTSPRLLALPDHVLAPADSEFCRLLIERVADQAGTVGDVVATRLLDWLVTETVRDVLVARAPDRVADAGVVAALAAVHADPAAAWTVAALADHAGVSRAAFARRFHDAVGVPPLAYVREHRLDVAEQALLTEPDLTVAAVARRVGYANPFSFSTAFRRHRGVAPSEVRAS